MSKHGENIFKRKDGRWEARVIDHYENGRAKYYSLYGHSYNEVKEKRLEYFKEPKNFVKSKCKCIAMFDEIAMSWLSEKKHTLKESSYANYYIRVIKHILPYFKKTPISKIDTQMVRKFACNLSESLSQNTVNAVITAFRMIWKYGIENGYPCQEIQSFKTTKKTKINEVKNISENDNRTIENLLCQTGDLTSLGIIFTYFTGVRIGELCGLRWEDIDLDERTVRIRRTIQRIKDTDPKTLHSTKIIITAPKTANSIRTIPLPQFLVDYIVPFKQDGDRYLLTGKTKFIEPNCWYRRYKSFLKQHGMQPDTKFHTLRHNFATKCVELGFDVKSLSEILGHANTGITMNLYVHPTIQMKRAQMDRLIPDYGQNSGQHCP